MGRPSKNGAGAAGPKSESPFAALFAHMTEGVALHELVRAEDGTPVDYRILDVNPSFEKKTGLAAASVRGALASAVYHERPPPHLELCCRVVASGQPCSFESFFAPLHRHFDVSCFAYGVDLFATVFEDVTERRATAQAMLQSEAKARAAYQHLPLPTLLWQRRAGHFVLIDINDAARAGTASLMAAGLGQSGEQAYPRRPDVLADLERCHTERNVFKKELEDADHDGRPRRLVVTYGFVPPDMVIVHTDDVTEQRAVEEQLRLSQKMEAIGQLAGGIAHDFNNLLAVIMSYLELSVEGLREGDPLRADLTEALKATGRATDLTRHLLAFGRRQLLKPEVIDVNRMVDGLRAMLRRLIGEHIELNAALDPQLGHVKADPVQLEQVIINLVVNARDSMPKGGKLVIETRNLDIDAAFADSRATLRPGPYVTVAVTDTGCGMDEQTRSRMFEPFFTTKEQGKGTGLGLATVYGIVQQSGGHISVYSEIGRGTAIRVCLPRVDREGAAINLKAPTAARGTETILVVEDEEGVRNLTRRILAAAGFTVLAAANGGEALLACEQVGARIDLLLTDVVMPRMNGRELADRLRQRLPKLKILFMSGYPDAAVIDQGHLDPAANFIAKPFSAALLTRRVRDLLDDVEGAPHSA